MKETSLSFCSFDSTWLSMVRLAKGTTTTQSALNFYQNEDGIFCLRCCCCNLLLFCCCLGRCQWIVCVAHPASVAHVTHGASVTWLYFLLVSCKFFITCFVVVLDILVVGDLRHEYAQSAWGFLFRGPPRYWMHLLRLCRSNWCSLMMIVIVGWVLLWYSWCLHDAFVGFVGKAALWFRGWSPQLSLLH